MCTLCSRRRLRGTDREGGGYEGPGAWGAAYVTTKPFTVLSMAPSRLQWQAAREQPPGTESAPPDVGESWGLFPPGQERAQSPRASQLVEPGAVASAHPG